MRTAIVDRPLDAAALLAEVASHDAGAATLFVGTVRRVNAGRDVTGIDYSAYGPMAERELQAIAAEAAERFGTDRLVVEHRLGTLGLGDASIVIAVSHARRAAAMDAQRFLIEEIKRRVPIWKREHYVDGTREWVDPTAPPAALRDQHGRAIEYLRISVTDRCNFRCVYCMPEAGLDWLPKRDILSYEEITEVVRQLAPLGLRRLRITGGEPTIRPDLVALVRMLRAVPGIEDIALSTNGVKLPTLAPALAEAGLDRVNLSADSLRPERIAAIARRSLGFDPVVALRAALDAGLAPVKLNVVVMRGINDDEVLDFARLSLELPVHVRFIELMPVGEMAHLTDTHIVPSDEVLARISTLGALAPVEGPARGNGPAAYHQFAGAPGTVGVITPMTHTYCGSCNRVRLTADGRLRTCLYGDHEVNLREPLRAGARLEPLFVQALAEKPLEHGLHQLRVGGLRALSEVGG